MEILEAVSVSETDLIGVATEILKLTGPLLVAIKRQGLEGKCQKEIAEAINRDEVWVSRRIQKAYEHKLVEIRESYRWGWHYTYGTFAKWKVKTIFLTDKGHEAVNIILHLDPLIQQCPSCNGLIDITGFSGFIRCPYCTFVQYVEGIEPPEWPTKVPPWIYLLTILVCGILGAYVDRKNPWRGFSVGATVPTMLIAIIDAIVK